MAKPFRRASVADHSVKRPDILERDGSQTWVTRGANFVIAVTRALAGCVLETPGASDEHMVVLHNTGATITIGSEQRKIGAGHLLIVPPGDSRIVAHEAGLVVRCYSARYASLVAKASNAVEYAEPRKEVAPIIDWPEPIGGYKLRIYNLQEGLAEGDKARVYRSSNLMINLLRERTVPRDITNMSPHSHDDFEQASIALSGTFVHYLRTPWIADMTVWRPDEAVEVGAPSVTVIPPPIIHTTRNLGDGSAVLIDLFCPPREDFSLRAGMVRNATEYPLPERLRQR